MKTFWTCWIENSNGGYGYKHFTLEDAKKEAERLAQSSPGAVVRVLQCLGTVTCKNTVWDPATDELEPDKLPF